MKISNKLCTEHQNTGKSSYNAIYKLLIHNVNPAIPIYIYNATFLHVAFNEYTHVGLQKWKQCQPIGFIAQEQFGQVLFFPTFFPIRILILISHSTTYEHCTVLWSLLLWQSIAMSVLLYKPFVIQGNTILIESCRIVSIPCSHSIFFSIQRTFLTPNTKKKVEFHLLKNCNYNLVPDGRRKTKYISHSIFNWCMQQRRNGIKTSFIWTVIDWVTAVNSQNINLCSFFFFFHFRPFL